MATPDPVEFEKKLRALEVEIDQTAKPGAPVEKAGILSRLPQWTRPLAIALAVLGSILLVGLVFKLLTQLLQILLVVGLGFLLYRYAIGPKLGLIKPKPKSDDLLES